jgi:hypothetical protein
MTTVVNSSPLIKLAAIDLLDLLRSLFGVIQCSNLWTLSCARDCIWTLGPIARSSKKPVKNDLSLGFPLQSC